jgi:hypothetical protein
MAPPYREEGVYVCDDVRGGRNQEGCIHQHHDAWVILNTATIDIAAKLF